MSWQPLNLLRCASRVWQLLREAASRSEPVSQSTAFASFSEAEMAYTPLAVNTG